MHRDLKPENIIFGNQEDLGTVKVTDFGLSSKFFSHSKLYMKCGSPGYVAPEILNEEGYNSKADIFSAGIIMYILLTGKFVFSGTNNKEIMKKNAACVISYPS